MLISCNTEEEPCDTPWTKDRSQFTATAKVADGNMRVEVVASEPGNAIAVFQDSIEGEFEISIDFDEFSPGTGDGGYAQVVLFDAEAMNAPISGASIGTGMIDAFVGYPNGSLDSRMTNGTSGTISISRLDGIVTSSISVGNKLAETSSVLTASPLRISIEVGSNQGQVQGTTGFTITRIRLSDDNGTIPDGFDCEVLL